MVKNEKNEKVYLGIDVGSVTTKLAALDEEDRLVTSLYLRTQGRPIAMIQHGLKELATSLPPQAQIKGVGTTGSARYLAGVMVSADVVKNEITAQAVSPFTSSLMCRPLSRSGGRTQR